MGIAVCALLKHDLNTSSIEMLAEQLAARLNATVIYGYMDDWTYEREATFDFVPLGVAGCNEHNILLLQWEYYFEAVMGVDLVYNDTGAKVVTASEQFLCFELRGMQRGDDARYVGIYRDCLAPGAFYAGKWGRFVSPFMNDDPKGWWEADVLEYRKDVQHMQQLFGCEPVAYYFPDSFSEAALIDEIAGTGTWNDVLAHIKKLSADNPTFDICRWYREQPGYLRMAPQVVKDDFSNLTAHR